MKTVAWFSGGVSSFISIYLIKDQIDEIIYIDIDDQVITARERSGGNGRNTDFRTAKISTSF